MKTRQIHTRLRHQGDRLNAPRPFLRAWALNALCHLQGSGAETAALLIRMEADAAASVRARVRNLRRVF